MKILNFSSNSSMHTRKRSRHSDMMPSYSRQRIENEKTSENSRVIHLADLKIKF